MVLPDSKNILPKDDDDQRFNHPQIVLYLQEDLIHFSDNHGENLPEIKKSEKIPTTPNSHNEVSSEYHHVHQK
jgi:hypothetical protein